MARDGMIVPRRTFKAGDVIFRQGDAGGAEAYLVHGGRVEVRQRTGRRERVLRTLRAGDLLGEVALFGAAPHSATAVAVERTTLLVIPATRLEEMVAASPKLAIALIRELARMASGAASASAQP